MSKKTGKISTGTDRRSAPARSPRRRWLLVGAVAAVVVIAAAIVFRFRPQDGSGAHHGTQNGFGHVHALGVEPGTGVLYAATHSGLYRIDDAGTAVRVSREAFDLMGFAIAGPQRFLGSGHPANHGAGPANLGLIESTDGGATWRPLSLSGEADFHGMVAVHGSVYGYNSTDGVFMVSTDGQTWERRSTVAIGGFTVSPTDPSVILAAGRTGVQRSGDGGRTWQPVAEAPPVATLSWHAVLGVWGVTPDGAVWRSGDGNRWERRSVVSGRPQAVTAYADTVFVALEGDRIAASADGGVTWTNRYAPA